MKSAKVVAVLLLLALSLAEAAPGQNGQGQNGQGQNGQGQNGQGQNDQGQNGKDGPQGPKNKDPYSPPPVYSPPPSPVHPPPPTTQSPPPSPVNSPPPTTQSPPPSPVYSPPPTTQSPPPSPVYPPPPTTQSPPPSPVYSPPPTTQSPPPSPVYSPPPTTPSPPPSPVYSPPPTTSSPPPSPVYSPPPSSSASGKRVRCKNKNYPSCYFRQFTCPTACPESCQVDCATCSPVCDCNRPGAVCQDPRFVGADGIAFYFHGKKDQNFCLVSDANIHINAHFIGKRNPKMGRDFTWVQALGILFNSHNLYIGAQKTATWNDAVDRLSLSFDGQPINLSESEGAKWESSDNSRVRITRLRATNAVEIEAEGNFKIKAVVVPITEKDSLIHKYGITQENCFAHLDLSFKFYSLTGNVNGVLGQTYGSNYVSNVKMGVAMPVLGGEKEFHSSGIFTTDCAAAKFEGNRNGNESSEGALMEFGDLNCASSGFSGRGVVCKR